MVAGNYGDLRKLQYHISSYFSGVNWVGGLVILKHRYNAMLLVSAARKSCTLDVKSDQRAGMELKGFASFSPLERPDIESIHLHQ